MPVWLHKAVLWAGQDAVLWARALALLTRLGDDADDEAWALGARACASGGAWEMALSTSDTRNRCKNGVRERESLSEIHS